jgi:hypothetical protein
MARRRCPARMAEPMTMSGRVEPLLGVRMCVAIVLDRRKCGNIPTCSLRQFDPNKPAEKGREPPNALGPSPRNRPPRCALRAQGCVLECSEVRFARNWDVVVEQMLVVLGAYGFYDLQGRAPIPPHCSPRRIESVRIVYRKARFQHLAIVDHFPALYNVQLFSMRRAVDVHGQSGVLADGVDDQRVPLIMPDRLAIPGRLRIFRMGNVQVDVTELLTVYDHDLL